MSRHLLGCYGLALQGLDGAAGLLPTVDGRSPTLRVVRRLGSCPDVQEFSSVDRAVLPLLEDALLELTRTSAAATATYTIPYVVSDEELIHPWLAAAAGILCRWNGMQVMHGGVVELGGRALLVLGDREAGKSTLLAHVARSDRMHVMADDLAVFAAGVVYAGPRCVDLRPPTAIAFGLDRPELLARDETRYRFPLAAGLASARLVGAIVLEWGRSCTIERVPVSQRLPCLLPHTGVDDPKVDAGRLLDLASTPVWVLHRPRTWDGLDDAAAAVESLLT